MSVWSRWGDGGFLRVLQILPILLAIGTDVVCSDGFCGAVIWIAHASTSKRSRGIQVDDPVGYARRGALLFLDEGSLEAEDWRCLCSCWRGSNLIKRSFLTSSQRAIILTSCDGQPRALSLGLFGGSGGSLLSL
jgi:hypothetical protein